MDEKILLGAKLACEEAAQRRIDAGHWVAVIHETAALELRAANGVDAKSREGGWAVAMVPTEGPPPRDGVVRAAVAANEESWLFDLDAGDAAGGFPQQLGRPAAEWTRIRPMYPGELQGLLLAASQDLIDPASEGD